MKRRNFIATLLALPAFLLTPTKWFGPRDSGSWIPPEVDMTPDWNRCVARCTYHPSHVGEAGYIFDGCGACFGPSDAVSVCDQQPG